MYQHIVDIGNDITARTHLSRLLNTIPNVHAISHLYGYGYESNIHRLLRDLQMLLEAYATERLPMASTNHQPAPADAKVSFKAYAKYAMSITAEGQHHYSAYGAIKALETELHWTDDEPFMEFLDYQAKLEDRRQNEFSQTRVLTIVDHDEFLVRTNWASDKVDKRMYLADPENFPEITLLAQEAQYVLVRTEDLKYFLGALGRDRLKLEMRDMYHRDAADRERQDRMDLYYTVLSAAGPDVQWVVTDSYDNRNDADIALEHFAANPPKE